MFKKALTKTQGIGKITSRGLWLVFGLYFPFIIWPADVHLAWDQNPETNIIAYNIWSRTAVTNTWRYVQTSTNTMASVPLPMGTHILGVTAVNDSNLESLVSQPVTAIVLRVSMVMERATNMTGPWVPDLVVTNYVVTTNPFTAYRARMTVDR